MKCVFDVLRLDLLKYAMDYNSVFTNRESNLIGRFLCNINKYYSEENQRILKIIVRNRDRSLVYSYYFVVKNSNCES